MVGRAIDYELRQGGVLRRSAVFMVGLGGALAVIAAGFLPNPYLMYVRNIAPPHGYPLDTVLWLLLLITIQGVLSWAVLRPASYRRSFGRAWAAMLLALPFNLFAIVSAMHAPPPVVAYIYWSWCVIAAAMLLGLWSSAFALRARFAMN